MQPRVAPVDVENLIGGAGRFPKFSLTVLDFRERDQQGYGIGLGGERGLHRGTCLVDFLLAEQSTDKSGVQVRVIRRLADRVAIEFLGFAELAERESFLCGRRIVRRRGVAMSVVGKSAAAKNCGEE